MVGRTFTIGLATHLNHAFNHEARETGRADWHRALGFFTPTNFFTLTTPCYPAKIVSLAPTHVSLSARKSVRYTFETAGVKRSP